MLTRRQQIVSWVVDQLDRRCPSTRLDLSLVLGRPTLQELSFTAPLFRDAASCIRTVVADPDELVLKAAGGEFCEVDYRVARRRAESPLRYPANFPVLEQTSLLLYSLVRLIRPLVVLETGVADGYSTAVILAAMQKNRIGQLHSLDIRDDVGVLVEDRERWHLHVSDEKRAFQDLSDLAHRLAPVDIFFHDSDHRFVPQTREYDLAERTVRAGGYLVSDDADYSHAFRQRVKGRGNRSAFLFDDLKCSGILRVG